jgi:phosphate-selective porin OprO/OprP
MKKKLLYAAIASYQIMATCAQASDTDFLQELQSLKAQLKAQEQLIKKLEAELNSKIAKQDNEITKLNASASLVKNDVSKNVNKDDVKITIAPSPKIESVDGRYSFQPLGSIHADSAVFNDDKNDHPDGSTVRRARLGFKGIVDNDINYKVELDFGNKDADDSVSFKDVYLEYTGLNTTNIIVGNFKPAYGLEALGSPHHTTFIELSLPSGSFSTDQIIGLQANNGGKNHSWAIGAHNDTTTTKSTDDEAKSIVGRVTLAPINTSDKTLHFGLSQSLRSPDSSSDSVSFDTQLENSLQILESAETGTISNVDSVYLTGIEAAALYGPVSIQGEYFYNKINRESLSDININGWYAQISYLLTSEVRPYISKKGIFGRIEPLKPFNLDNKTWGAWELAARYSNIDLNDGNKVQGGEINNITLGLNWYLNNNTRLMANYIIGNTDSVTPSGANVLANDDPKIILLRAAIDF